MRDASVRRLVAAHGPFQGGVAAEDWTASRHWGGSSNCRDVALVMVEALLAAAGLLDRPGLWTLRLTDARDRAGDELAVEVREATATAVRLVLRPAGLRVSIDCHLLVFREKGEPREVRQKLKDVVVALRAADPPCPARAPDPPPVPPRPKYLIPAAGVPGRDDVTDFEAVALAYDWAFLSFLVAAVDAAADAPSLGAFVWAVGLEFGPAQRGAVWTARLAAFARCGVLVERRAGTTLTGYTVTDVGRGQLAALGGPGPLSARN